MATINLGRVKPVFRGAYSGATAYVVDDIVTYSNETYICILASTGNLPTDTTYWTKLAAKGVDGTDLTSTLTTQGDIVYRDGSGLARLGAGTSGQFLKTQGTGANPVWGDLSAEAGKYAFYTTVNPDQSVPNTTVTEFVGNSVVVNTGSKYSTSTGRYTPGEAGTYYFWFQWTANGMTSTADQPEIWFHINGSGTRYGQSRNPGGGTGGYRYLSGSAILTLTNTDYVSVFAYQNGGAGRVFGQYLTWFGGYKLA